MPAMSYWRPGSSRTNSMFAPSAVKSDRERRRGLLSPERFLEDLVPAVDVDAVARNVGRSEEREPHDVVPVHVRHEDVIRLRRFGAMTRHRLLAEGPHARTQVAQHVIGTPGFQFDAGSMSAVAPSNREAHAVDVGGDFIVRCEVPAGRSAQRADQLVAHAGCGQCDGQGTARTPEPDALHVAAAS